MSSEDELLGILNDHPEFSGYQLRRYKPSESYWHDIFLLENEAEEKFILKVYRSASSKEDVQFEVESILTLQKTDLNVPELVETSTKNSIHFKDEERYFSIQRFIEGRALDCSKGEYSLIGESLAKLHSLDPDNFPKTHSKYPVPFLDMPRLTSIATELFAAHGFDTSIVEEFQERFDVMLETLDPQAAVGFVHGDLHANNCIVTSSDNLYLVDFDTCGVTFKLYDLGVLSYNLLWEPHFSCVSKSAWQDTLEGYESILELSDSDHEAIDLFMLARFFEVFGYTNFDNCSDFVKHHYNFLKGWMKVLK